MADADLPAVSRSRPGDPPPLPVRGGEPGAPAAPAEGASRPHRGVVPLLAGLPLATALGLVVALGLASLLGERVRSAVLVEVETVPQGPLSFRDAPEEARRFFEQRDTVTVTVPRDMTVAEFLALYHLETSAPAREALRDQLGAGGDADPLREGDRVTFPLTRPRPRSP